MRRVEAIPRRRRCNGRAGRPDRPAMRADRQIMPGSICRVALRTGRERKAQGRMAPGTVPAKCCASRGAPRSSTCQETRMSILGAMNTAVSGLTAQSASFSNISDNVANSQTVGFKGVNTSFSDYLTTSTSTVNDPGTVVASPAYSNTVQGTISQSTNSLALAISGQGFFDVSQPTGTTGTGAPVFATQQYYTRGGNFQLNASGYLTNDSGQYLNGWIVDAGGVLNKSSIVPIQVSQSVYKPVATENMTMAANLPAGLVSTVTEDAHGNVNAMYDSSGNQVSAIQPNKEIYDAEGTAHTVQYTWTPQPSAAPTVAGGTIYTAVANTWVLSASLDGNDLGEVTVNFASDGTLVGVGPEVAGAVAANGTGTATPGAALIGAAPTYSNASSGTVTYDTGLPTANGGTQKVTLNLGDIGLTNGVTQFSANGFTLRGLNQDGVPPGSFTSISTQTSGDIYANYDNGQTRLIARVPVATFGDADALQSQNGCAYTVTNASGNPSLQDAGTNGAGSLVTSSVESSNVDIASEFSHLIVAQQAYSANAKVVTTADQLMQTTISMIR
jgi:flagellar hook protein FlgE